jgi:glycosyltransferase involved in cell wall biosynthesis
VKIAYVGDFINHGKSLATTGTSLVFLLSTFDSVDSIDVYCPNIDKNIEEITLPEKVKVIETYRYDSSLSLLNLFRLRHLSYDKIIFNMLSTTFGNSSFSNAFGLCIPIIMVKAFQMQNVEVIYHNSVLTNDVTRLGYTSLYDRLRSRILRVIEGAIFKNVTTFVLLKLYVERITSILKENRVQCLNARYLEAISTVFINELQDEETLELSGTNLLPMVLLHGNWGPQKNIELGIETLDRIRKDGVDFNLVITGGMNHHFPEYEKHFMEILDRYNFAGCYKGTVTEKEIFTLFTTSDLLLLPYNIPGGHSGVLEQAIFFEIPTIAIDFPEYREQTEGVEFIRLTSLENFYLNTKRSLQINLGSRDVHIKLKLKGAVSNIKTLL